MSGSGSMAGSLESAAADVEETGIAMPTSSGTRVCVVVSVAVGCGCGAGARRSGASVAGVEGVVLTATLGTGSSGVSGDTVMAGTYGGTALDADETEETVRSKENGVSG